MKKIPSIPAALVSAVALGSFAVGTLPAAHADAPAACAQQQAQLDKATAKLADLTAKFAAHPTHKNLKAKKAQQSRVSHATARLATCEAAVTS
jgi:hypothetical protein